MTDAEETRRRKAANLRYRRPIVKDLNLDAIIDNLSDIQDACEGVRWYFEEDDDTLINALDGDDDEAFEFKMMFGDLCAECSRLRDDLDEVTWGENSIKEAFNIWFPAIRAGEMIGWDPYESDYMPIVECGRYGYGQEIAWEEAQKRIMRMTKEQILRTAELSFRIVRSYLGLMTRYDQLKAAMDILRDQNTGYLQMIKRIEELYDKANKSDFYIGFPEVREFDRMLNNLPQEAWIQ